MNELEMRVAALEAKLGLGNFMSVSAQQKDAVFNGHFKLINRTALPAHCAKGELAVLNGVLKICSAADTWTTV